MNLTGIRQRSQAGDLDYGFSSGLFWLHLFIFLSMGLANLAGPVFVGELSGTSILWVFVSLFFLLQTVLLLEPGRDGIVKSRHTWWLAFFYVLCMWRTMQIGWSLNELETAKAAVKTAVLGAFAFGMHHNMNRLRSSEITGYLAAVVVTLLTASLAVYTWLLMFQGDLSLYGSKLFKPEIVMFGGSNTSGAVVLLLGSANWALVLSDNRLYRIAGFYNAIVTLVLLGGIASYAALAGYVGMMVVLLLFFLWKSKRYLFLPFVSLIGLALFAVSVPETAVPHTFDFGHLRSIHLRMDIWSVAREEIRNGAWMIGLGAGTYSETATLGFSVPLRGGFHNAFLQSLVEGGVVEFALHIGLYLWLVFCAVKAQYRYRAILSAFALAVFIRNCAESDGILFGLVNNFSVFLSWYVLTVLLVLAKRESSGAPA